MRCYECWKSVAAWICGIIVLGGAVSMSGCHSPDEPRLRMGAYFGSPTGMSFPNVENLGRHSFKHSMGEKNGMVYTCRGGFIDLGHLREAADRTEYIAGISYQNLIQNKEKFSFSTIEPSRYWVKVRYPPNWKSRDIKEKTQIAHEASISLGQYIAHKSMVWHEIITWYGFASTGIFSEKISSFSPEDGYSDLLGTVIAARALRDVELKRESQSKYDEAMTSLIYKALKELDAQPPGVGRKAEKKIEGKWFTGGLYFFVDMKKRNFDIGLDNGKIVPWLVQDICPNTEPQACPVPNMDYLLQHGFKVEVEIDPRILEKDKIYRVLHLKDGESFIRPEVHFPEIMARIQNQAVVKKN